MIGLKVINLFLEQQCPEIFAEEFDGVERVCEVRAGCGESVFYVSIALQNRGRKKVLDRVGMKRRPDSAGGKMGRW